MAEVGVSPRSLWPQPAGVGTRVVGMNAWGLSLPCGHGLCAASGAMAHGGPKAPRGPKKRFYQPAWGALRRAQRFWAPFQFAYPSTEIEEIPPQTPYTLFLVRSPRSRPQTPYIRRGDKDLS
jgi:hypothetical protein